MVYRVVCTHEMQDLVHIRASWEALQALSRNLSIFQSWLWVSTYWKHFGDEAELWLVQAYDAQDTLVGLAPMMRRPSDHALHWRSLEFIAVPLGNDHADFIIEAGREAPVIRAFLDWFEANCQFGEIMLKGLPADSPSLPILQSGSERWQVLETRYSPYIPIRGTWDDFHASLSKGKRKNLRQYHNRLDAAYGDAWRCEAVTDPDKVTAALDQLMDWHQLKWTGRGAPGNFDGPAQRAFHHDFAQACLERGWLMMYVLIVADEIVTVDYNYLFMNQIFAFAGGIQPDCPYNGTSHLLIEAILKRAFTEGIDRFDFLWGQHDYKVRWGAQSREELVLACATGLRARLYRQSLQAARSVWRAGKHLLPADIRTRLRSRFVDGFVFWSTWLGLCSESVTFPPHGLVL